MGSKQAVVKYNERKTFRFTQSGRSSDFIAPSFNYGCLASCRYCYMRRHVRKGLTVATNHQDVLNKIGEHATEERRKDIKKFPKFKQTDPYYITYDIGCNEDIALHQKFLDLPSIISFFNLHPFAKSTFATKYPKKLISKRITAALDKYQKNRVRVSLMPQTYSEFLEPSTESILDRILSINYLIEQGWEVHINFSPVIVSVAGGWKHEYKKLFQLINKSVKDEYKDGRIKAEVIFLTHNKAMHEANEKEIEKTTLPLYKRPNALAEQLIWTPINQEAKISNNGEVNIRYKHELKSEYIKMFKHWLNEECPWLKIRYIF